MDEPFEGMRLMAFCAGVRRLFSALPVLLVLVASLPAIAQEGAGRSPATGLPALETLLGAGAPETPAVNPIGGTPGVGPWARTAEADVRLIAARTATGAAETVRLGLQFDLKPGWKVYWRSPGDAGYPPSLDWQAADNLAGLDWSWPVPHRFEILGIQTAGYKDQVVLPLTARLKVPGAGVSLRGTADYLICSDICIPGMAEVSLDLPPGEGRPGPEAQLIERYAAQVPGPGQGITLDEVVIEQTPEGLGLAVAVTADPPVMAPDLFVEGPLRVGEVDAGYGIVSGPTTVALADGGRRAVLRAALVQDYPDGVPELTLTIAGQGRGLEVTATPAPGRLTADITPVAPVAPAGLSLWVILGLAVIGGLILNAMPCVLPVLSLKVMAFMGHGGGHKGEARAAFLASSAGIIAAFLVLAAILAVLKAGGTAIGWGIQFQQPWFLTAMVLLLTLFAANLWGLFEVPLPSFLGSAGAGLGAPRSLLGHFAAGAFATVLATPCSAPFLGTAVGFALARGPGEIAAVFGALGVGMALPYLAIAAVPSLATRLPRPGPWMIRFKQVMGLLLVGTAVWLLSVLGVQVGWRGVLILAVLMAVLLALFAVRHRLRGGPQAVLSLAVVAVLAASFAVPALQTPATPVPAGGEESAAATDWRTFDEAAIASLVAEGRIVFVDVTADWCITCKVNKAAVLDRDPVAAALAAPGVVPMQADWTRPDDGIAAYLARYGRYGIPFNIVYGPGAPEGLPLPELLTDSAVLDALRRAGGVTG